MAIERRNANWKRRADDHLFEAIFMAMDEGAVFLNKSGEVVAVNPAAEKILGFAATELTGLSAAKCVQVLNLVTEDETPLSPELHSGMLALQTGKPQRSVLVGAYRPDGTLVWLSMNAQPLVLDGEPAPHSVVITFRDVTEPKRTEDALYFVAQRGWKDNANSLFAALAQYLGKTLGVDYAVIKRLNEDSGHVETITLYAKGAIIPNRRFPIEGTPYKNVLEQKFCIYPQGVRQLFPNDPLLAEMGTESYAGLALWDSAGHSIGMISVMCSRPLREQAVVSKILQIVAPRVAAELERERNERNLRQSERKFRTLAENIPDNLIRYDLQTRVQYMNSAMKADVAPEVLPVLGKSPTEAFPGNDAAAAHQRVIERAIATGIPGELEFQIPNLHGEMRFHHVRYVAEHDSNGEIVGALGIGRDITERKLAEKYEQFRSQTLELLSGSAPLQDLLEGIVLGVEQLRPEMICSILLLDSRGKHLGEGIAPRLPDFYNAAIDGIEIGVGVGCCGTAAATGKRVIVDDIQTHPYWTPYKELAARAGLGSCWSEPIHSSSGHVLGTFAIYHREVHSPAKFDISLIEKSVHLVSIAIEHKRAEEALRASEERMRLFFERQLVGTAITSPEKGWVQVNDKLCEMLGYTREELLRLTWPELTYPEDLAPDLAQFERLLNGKIDGYTLEKRFVRKDGSIVFTNLAVGCVRRANRSVNYVLALLEDITGRKRNEAELERHRHHLEKLVEDRTLALSAAKETAEAATRAKSHFLAAASHDMRQPLQAIRLFNDALSLTKLDERQMKISHNLAKSVNSLGELLNQLLDLSRLDAGMIEPQLVAIQAVDLLGMIEAEFDAVFREKNLSLNFYCPRSSLALFSDETLLLTLLRNLVSNAVKYTARGGVLVSIRRRGDRALIQVWDTGIGIAPELSDSIFDEYFQIGNPERDRAKGVGLGLSIVRRLCGLLDIEMGLRSRPGQGSVFELGVPLAGEPEVRAPAIQNPASPDTVAPTRLAGKRIVVIEDDAIVAEAIKLSLEMAGARVSLFGTAEDALGSEDAIAADHYISDYRLPGMDGLQLLNTIQTNSATPINAVLLTGNTAPDQMAITQASRWEVLLKPINLHKLLSAIER